jgi:hypothetical protein
MISLLTSIMDLATRSPFLCTNFGVGSMTPYILVTLPPSVAPGTINSHLGGISTSSEIATF